MFKNDLKGLVIILVKTRKEHSVEIALENIAMISIKEFTMKTMIVIEHMRILKEIQEKGRGL